MIALNPFDDEVEVHPNKREQRKKEEIQSLTTNNMLLQMHLGKSS